MSGKFMSHTVRGDLLKSGFESIDRRLKVDAAIGWAFRKLYYGKPKKIVKNRIFVMSDISLRSF